MSASPSRRGALPPATDRTARVLAVETGVVVVATRTGVVRATIGGTLLGRMAADPAAEPREGDRVRLRTWADGRATVEGVVARTVGDTRP